MKGPEALSTLDLFLYLYEMRKVLTFFVLIAYLSSFSEFGQLLKLPQLVKHFKEHQLVQPDLQVMQFLQMHYTGIFEVDDDYQQDQKLPFRTTLCQAHVVLICDAPVQMHAPLPNVYLLERKFELNNDPACSMFGYYDIFQPPRI